MMGIGFWEMVVIVAVALVVIGPDRFPGFAKLVMRTLRDLRGYVNEVKEDIASELQPVKKELDELSRYRPEEYLEALTKSTEESVDAPPQPRDAPETPPNADSAQHEAETDEKGEVQQDAPPPRNQENPD